jgi:hypothetical protein
VEEAVVTIMLEAVALEAYVVQLALQVAAVL